MASRQIVHKEHHYTDNKKLWTDYQYNDGATKTIDYDANGKTLLTTWIIDYDTYVYNCDNVLIRHSSVNPFFEKIYNDRGELVYGSLAKI